MTVREWRIRQDGETPIQLHDAGWIAFRYAYARSADTRAANDLGQDYLTFAVSDRVLVFALCDGVSQSFFGDIAATFLGDALVKWLKGRRSPAADPQAMQAVLADHLVQLTAPATALVAEHPLPPGTDALLRDVLEEKRAGGSDTTFVCGRIDRPSRARPDGNVLLAWLGDSRLRIWAERGEATPELGETFQTRERWSSRRGPVGSSPHVWLSSLANGGGRLDRILAYSDGLATLDAFSQTASTFALQDLLDRAEESATSDDVSLLEIWLDGIPRSVAIAPLLPPQQVIVKTEPRGISAHWQAIPGIDRYEVEVRGRRIQTWQTDGCTWSSPPPDAGSYQLRVRVRAGEEPGQWSSSVAFAIEPGSSREPEPHALPPPVYQSAFPQSRDRYAFQPPTGKRFPARRSRQGALFGIALALIFGLSIGALLRAEGLLPGTPRTKSTSRGAVIAPLSPNSSSGPPCPTTGAPASKAAAVQWTCLSSSKSPSARAGASLAKDGQDHVLLFGGRDGGMALADTWSWNGKNWSQLLPRASPLARNDAILAPASAGGLILTGGVDANGSPLSDTWSWNGSGWQQQTGKAVSPARSQAGAAYDAREGELVLFGGSSGRVYLSDTWIWRGADWSPVQAAGAPAGHPSGRAYPAMAFDAASQRVLLFGGWGDASWLGDTWAWDASGQRWMKVNTGNVDALAFPVMVAAPGSGALVLMGEDTSTPGNPTEILQWNSRSNTWTRIAQSTDPNWTITPAAAPDPRSGGVLLFGGVDTTNASSAATWLLRLTDSSPSSPAPESTSAPSPAALPSSDGGRPEAASALARLEQRRRQHRQ